MIKPRIFIGSSTERLDIAYAIQQNLERYSEPTVWTQGIFDLSSSTLDSLVNSLKDFDYAIFAFHPDDKVFIRDKKFEAVRDNLIFELGLFMGKLGPKNVFFLIPRDSKELHLPSDLLGINPGTYDSNRRDGNLQASLGPFCSQVRAKIKNFAYINMEGFKSESEEIQNIIINKPKGWEFILSSALLKKNIKRIDSNYIDIENDFIIQRIKSYSIDELFSWLREVLVNIDNYMVLFLKAAEGLKESWGEKGVEGQPIEIKNAIDDLIQLCDELIKVETELLSIQPPDELLPTKKKMKGFTKSLIIEPLKELQKILDEIIERLDEPRINEEKIVITLNPKLPVVINEVVEDFRRIMLG